MVCYMMNSNIIEVYVKGGIFIDLILKDIDDIDIFVFVF